MTAVKSSGTFSLGDRLVRRMGYGAMQLAGPRVFGPPANRAESLAVLRESVARGVNHIDTSDFYGPHVTNQLIRQALYPYPKDLVIVTKVGVRRSEHGDWISAASAADLSSAVHDNLRNLQLDVLDVVNFRVMLDEHRPAEGSVEPALTALAELQHRGLVRHIGLSHATAAQISAGRRICKIVCVQNHYNLTHRTDDALIDELSAAGIAYVPYFPLGGLSSLPSSVLAGLSAELGVTARQMAIAWLLQRAPNMLLIPGTSSRTHLRENLAAGEFTLPQSAVDSLDSI